MIAADVRLREVTPDDVPVFFAQQRDSIAVALAVVPSREWEPFSARWADIVADPSITKQTIAVDDVASGHLVSWSDEEGRRWVGYWLARELWGRGIATRALAAFLPLIAERPLFADVAPGNIGSRRVLEKNGFVVISTTQEEILLRLDGLTARD
ncbi:MAG: GNAT family N-acetyltransferase [Chloroflexota bacterium]